MVASVSAIGYFLPIFAFLLVFVVTYAILKKSEILGKSEFVMLLISFILASFFIVQASLVEFVQFTSAWIGVVLMVLFSFILVFAFIPGKLPDNLKAGGKSVGIIFGAVLLLLVFIFSFGYVFDTAVNWILVQKWLRSDWFGFILLLIIGGIVAAKVKK